MKIDHDIHIHTHLSDCSSDEQMTMENAARIGKELGLTTMCFTDHVWDADVPDPEPWYIGQDIAHSQSDLPLPEIEGMRLLHGCETEYCGYDKFGLTKKHFDQYDFVVIPINHFHKVPFVRPSHIKTPAQAAELYMERLEQLIKLDLPFHKTGIAHLNTTLGFYDDQTEMVANMTEQRMKPVFEFFAKHGAGVELNAFGFLPGWKDEMDANLWIFRIAKEAGCKFYYSSDAHTRDQIDNLKYLEEVTEILGLTKDDIYVIEGR